MASRRKKRPKPPQSRKRLLTPQQERRLRILLPAGATRDEAAAEVGITRSLLDTRLRDQLRDLRVGRGRRERRQPVADPTPEEIAARAAEVRRSWTEEERDRRRLNFSGPPPDD